jgi:hypothetical protein
MTEWISNWKQRYWWHSKHVPVPNVDLWIELDQLASLHKPTWVWTRGHADHEDDVRCDLLARNAAATQKSSWPDARRHAPLPLNLGADYVPPKPQAGLSVTQQMMARTMTNSSAEYWKLSETPL